MLASTQKGDWKQSKQEMINKKLELAVEVESQKELPVKPTFTF